MYNDYKIVSSRVKKKKKRTRVPPRRFLGNSERSLCTNDSVICSTRVCSALVSVGSAGRIVCDNAFHACLKRH